MKKIIVILSVCVGILIACLIAVCSITGIELAKYEAMTAEQEVLFEQELNDAMISDEWYKQDGYEDLTTWWNDLIEQKEDLANIASETFDNVGNYFTDEQEERLINISEEIQASHSIIEITNLTLEAEEIEAAALVAKEEALAAAAQQKASKSNSTSTVSYSNNSSGSSGSYSGNFKSDGVIYDDGYRYTYYSSNVLRHYRTNEWTAGSDGIYRDSDGYVIVASDDDAYGSTVSTPFGTGKVYDSGPGSGTRDIYVNY